MTRKGIAALALGFAASSGAAWANVTPEQVWQAWQEAAAAVGQTTKAESVVREGDTLVATGIVGTMEGADMSMTQTIDAVRMRDLGDGTVEILISPEITIASRTTSGEVTTEMVATGHYEGVRVIASGEPGRMTWDFTADRVAVSYDSMIVDGEQVPFDFDFALSDVSGRYLTAGLAPMQLEGTIAAGQFTLTGAGDSPDDDGSFEMTVTMDAIEGTFSASIPEGASMAGAALLSSGLNLDMKLAYGPVRADVAFAAEDGEGAVTSSAASGTFDMALAPESLTYASTGTGIAYAMEASTLPVPSLAATIAEAAFRLHAPLAPADAPADFQVLTALRGLELDDNLWSLFDPTAMLDRGAANLVIDLSGKVRLLADIFGDPEAMAEMDTPPAELHALTLNDLELTVAGAQLTGTGAFTFDNTRTEMLDGFPQPAGKAMFKLVGATALIDKLVQMGLLPEESAMQARMSLMMLAKPTGAEDSFTSEVEVSPEGKLLVNGVALN